MRNVVCIRLYYRTDTLQPLERFETRVPKIPANVFSSLLSTPSLNTLIILGWSLKNYIWRPTGLQLQNNDTYFKNRVLICKTAHRIAITKITMSILFSESVTDSFESHTKCAGESVYQVPLQHAVHSYHCLVTAK
jgi:hypothetical protein